MFKKNLVFMCLICVFLFGVSIVFADTIYLKNGEKIKGKIGKEEAYGVWVEVGGGRVFLSNEEIESIDKSVSIEPFRRRIPVLEPENNISSNVVISGESNVNRANSSRLNIFFIFAAALVVFLTIFAVTARAVKIGKSSRMGASFSVADNSFDSDLILKEKRRFIHMSSKIVKNLT